MQAILFDLDGVFYLGETPIAGGAAALAWVHEHDIPHLFLTNTTSRPRQAIVDKLAGLGIVVPAEQLLTPAICAARWLTRQGSGPLALFVPEATRSEFADFHQVGAVAETGAAAVVIGDLGPAWDFATLNRAFRLLMQSPPPLLVALGMTRYWRTEEGLQLDAGPFVRALEYASGLTATVMGKPAPAFFETATAILGLPAGELLMVGDDIHGDIEAAQACGIPALQVKTGKYSDRDLASGVTPAGRIESVAALPAWWAKQTEA